MELGNTGVSFGYPSSTFRISVYGDGPPRVFLFLVDFWRFGANEGMKQAPGNKLFRVTLWGTYETAGLGGWLTPYTIGYEAL